MPQRQRLPHSDYKELPKVESKHSKLDKVRDKETVKEMVEEIDWDDAILLEIEDEIC